MQGDIKGLEIYAVIRSHMPHGLHSKVKFNLVDYHDRYNYIDEMDVIVSATSGPHYTLTAHKIRESIKTEKPRIFLIWQYPLILNRL